MSITYATRNQEITGLSTDTKPTNVMINTLFLELDTGDFYYYDGSDWQEVGGSSSSENKSLSVEKALLKENVTPSVESSDDEGEEDDMR